MKLLTWAALPLICILRAIEPGAEAWLVRALADIEALTSVPPPTPGEPSVPHGSGQPGT